MKEILNEISQLTSNAKTEPTATDLPGVVIIKGEVPEHQLAAIYEPMIGVIIQGRKTISIGDQVINLKPPAYFVVPMEIPATGRVHQGPNGLPYLSVGLSINQNSLLDLLKDLPDDLYEEKVTTEFAACEATTDFLEAWLRMLRLLKTPEHIPALAPVYEREILYRVLLGPQGWRLRQVCRTQKGPSINQAIQWIRKNFTKPMEIKRMAAKSAIGVTTFHRQFKQITGLSPIQFQKQLRLLEARKLLVFSGYPVSHAAFEVGYESVSQFNREYSRFFGTPPARDASNLRQIEVIRNIA
ncbi:AraC family transcriptional regulator [Leptospira kobayashii]|uniref:AraC family transcriptional regulator n=1 Tax=Leptospira kobayashii TaxID=1917830 RepID=A0ABN6KA59_9LEPT|nr:AraC family transcriptional regulator [Leptospira kobayashii]BDA77461.1 AraC family transcriptional regulator [Leptospira kobayashii]